MTPGNRLFSNGDLADTLNHKLGQIANAVAGRSENDLLELPQADIYETLRARFIIDPIVLDRDGITAEPIEDGYMATRHFGLKVTTVTGVVPISGDQALLGLRPNHYTHNPPAATVRTGELRISWSGPVNPAPSAVQQGIDKQLHEIQQWLDWSKAQVTAYDESAGQLIVSEVQARKERALANRGLQASLGFPMRKRADADTYAVPITRKKIAPRRTAPTAQPFKPEPALDNKQYEAALEVLWHQRNQLERAFTTVAKMGEEQIRDLLLVNLNGHFEGQAAGEVFNAVGKTDILIREEDRHIFIGECKIWRGPKTITDTLNQLLSYLTWRDTKAALVLFIRSGIPSETIAKALVKFREHPNYKREGQQLTGERHDFVFTATSDPNQEIKLAFLPFHLPKPRSDS
ncbi:hypothetical protein [Streptomyces sp. NRRL F-2664]|uniref:hypothetical protein n=1 Tax=Streptomyces sp. NRRL F-2664 TaxID=1463842 RepID=UPI0004C77162|nr:hypothetical protein [Streptomyces sp. NRRL F-2664]